MDKPEVTRLSEEIGKMYPLISSEFEKLAYSIIMGIMSAKSERGDKMSRFIVMDIVFYGGSLNYDQGTGNYQELKKITKWDGRQYAR